MSKQPTERQTILGGSIGNALEWYDFAVYGYLAPIIGRNFFPSDDAFASLLAAFGVFAIGYGARPLGGILLGHIGDRFGRKPVLLLSVMMMGACTTAIGLLPGYLSLGDTAPILLILLRILQGISVGGEFSGSIIFLAEHADPRHRGYMASWPEFGALTGFLLGSATGALIGGVLGETALEEWGWRVPFLLGGLIAALAIFLRRRIPEPPAFQLSEQAKGLPIVEALREHWRTMLHLVALVSSLAVGFFLVFTYAVSYLTEQMHISTARALEISTISMMVMLAVTPVAGALSDRLGRKPILYSVSVGTLLFSWPLWWMMHRDALPMILAGQIGFSLLFGAGYAVVTAAIVELLPARVRCSAVSFGYNLCLGVFGGTAPLVATYLVHRTADDYAPVYYLMAAAIFSTIAVSRMPEMARKPLP